VTGLGALAHWRIGALAHWRIGALAHFAIGAIFNAKYLSTIWVQFKKSSKFLPLFLLN
jgi:hypothetical protein